MSGCAWRLKSGIEKQIILEVVSVKEMIADDVAIFFDNNVSSICVEGSVPRFGTCHA